MLRQLESRAARSWTGALRFDVPGASEPASVYLYEGGAYAVELPWYRPHVLARLTSAGILDATRQAIIDTSVGRDADPMDAVRFCVDQGWLDAERLGSIHGEFVLASLGALAEAGREAGAEDGAVTDRYCTLPMAVADVEEALRVRAARDTAAWGYSEPATSTQVARALAGAVAEHQVPEVIALVAALDHPMPLDAAAGRCGFTRSECAYIVSALASQGVVSLSPGAPDLSLQVPEALPVRAGMLEASSGKGR